jgi:hypothetical protein
MLTGSGGVLSLFRADEALFPSSPFTLADG